MTDAIHLVLPLTPLLNRYYRKFNNRMILSAEAIAYKAEVKAICRNLEITPFDGYISLRVYVYRARKAGDIDGYLKGLMDSLIGHTYHDDKQVIELHVYRIDDKHNPRVEVTTMDLGPIIDEKAERKQARALKKVSAR